jgi:hypothetical protein
MIRTVLYYMCIQEGTMNRKTVRNIVIATDAACWGALAVLAIHFFTCPMA